MNAGCQGWNDPLLDLDPGMDEVPIYIHGVNVLHASNEVQSGYSPDEAYRGIHIFVSDISGR